MSRVALPDDDLARGLELLRAAAKAEGVAAVARRLDYSRPAVSMVLTASYVGRPDRLILRALERLGAVMCPHLDATLSADDCRAYALRPLPTSSPAALRHWEACRTCARRPAPADGEA